MPRLTNHGEVVFEATSNGRIVHNFWGPFQQWWPGKAEADVGCNCNDQQGQQQQQVAPQAPLPPTFASVEEWFDAVAARPSDFHEHMPTLRDLAAKSGVCVELSAWFKPALLAMAAGGPKKLVSVCPGFKPEWGPLKQLLEPDTEFSFVQQDPATMEPVDCDLFMPDTAHQAKRLWEELSRWAPKCRHYIVVHCTDRFGELADNSTPENPQPGVLPALRKFLKDNMGRWGVTRDDGNNNGLMVLSCDPADWPAQERGAAGQLWGFAKAMAKHVASGLKVLPEEKVQARLDICATCTRRAGDRCSKCGCWLVERPDGGAGKTLLPAESCPAGKWHDESVP